MNLEIVRTFQLLYVALLLLLVKTACSQSAIAVAGKLLLAT
jgi:hypothetical protein